MRLHDDASLQSVGQLKRYAKTRPMKPMSATNLTSLHQAVFGSGHDWSARFLPAAGELLVRAALVGNKRASLTNGRCEHVYGSHMVVQPRQRRCADGATVREKIYMAHGRW